LLFQQVGFDFYSAIVVLKIAKAQAID